MAAMQKDPHKNPKEEFFRQAVNASDAGRRQRLLVEAAKAGDLWKIRLLHEERGMKLNANKEEALVTAAREGQRDIVEYLVAKGCDPKIESSAGTSPISFRSRPLYEAAMKGHWDIVEFLADHGADLAAANSAVIEKAALSGKHDVLKRLLARRPFPFTRAHLESVLLGCAVTGRREALGIILDGSVAAGPAFALDANYRPRLGFCILARAVEGGHGDLVNDLLARGADPFAHGAETLDIACRQGRADILVTILSQGYPRMQDYIETHLRTRPPFTGAAIFDLLADWKKPKTDDEKKHMHAKYKKLIPFGAEDLGDKDRKGRTLACAFVLAGDFDRAIRPHFASLSAAAIIARDESGMNLIEALDKYGEAGKLFEPSLWKGREADFLKVWEETPLHIQQKIDASAMAAAFTRQRLARARKPKKPF